MQSKSRKVLTGFVVMMFVATFATAFAVAEPPSATTFPVGTHEWIPQMNMTLDEFYNYTGIEVEENDTITTTIYAVNDSELEVHNFTVTVGEDYVNYTISNYTALEYVANGTPWNIDVDGDDVDVMPLFPLYEETIYMFPVKDEVTLGDWTVSVLENDTDVEETHLNASGNETEVEITYSGGESLYITDGDDEFYMESYSSWLEEEDGLWYDTDELAIETFEIADDSQPVIAVYNYEAGAKKEATSEAFAYAPTETDRTPSWWNFWDDYSAETHDYDTQKFAGGTLVSTDDVAKLSIKSGWINDYDVYVESDGSVYTEKSFWESPEVTSTGVIDGLTEQGTLNGVDYYNVESYTIDGDTNDTLTSEDITSDVGVRFDNAGTYEKAKWFGLLGEESVDVEVLLV